MTVATVTVTGQADIRQRLNADGLRALGLGSPLLSPVWTAAAAPPADLQKLRFGPAVPWYAPLPGMLIPVADGRSLGLSGFDGTPAEPGVVACAVLLIHPQARLRLERALVRTLEAAGVTPVDVSVRPVPATVLIRNPVPAVTLPQQVAAADLVMPAGEVSMYDEHGLAVDPFAFAAAVAAVLAATPALGAPMPAGGPNGTPVAIAGLAAPGTFVHLVDLHGRPWTDPPGATPGVGLFTGTVGNRTEAVHLGDGSVQAWPAGAVLSATADPDSAAPGPASLRFGWGTVGALGTMPLPLPAAAPPPPGTQVPVRDTLRVVVADPSFHLLGNRTAVARAGVGGADAMSVAEAAPQIRLGSPVTLLPDGRSVLGWMEQWILALNWNSPQAGTTSGPLFAATVQFDPAPTWPMPTLPGPAGHWPASPPATAVPGSDAALLAAAAPLRTGTTANWVQGTNDVLVTLPNGLPQGLAVRLYPITILMGTSPDEQPLLWRGDGGATVATGTADTVLLRDPFTLGATATRPVPPPTLRVDAAVTWLPAAVGALPRVKLVANLACPVGADVLPPGQPQANTFGFAFWRGNSASPLLGATPRGSFNLATIGTDPIAFVQSVVRQLTTDQNPREAPRLPTMARTESLYALQLLPAGSPDRYRAALTGGWLARETDTHSYRLANPAAVGNHEVHSPGVAAGEQLGFDLWVAAAHRARPVVPTLDIAGPITGGPNNGVPNNWALIQANTASQPPLPPTVSSSISAALLQTVPAYVETPELALIPDDDLTAVQNWITQQLSQWVSTQNDPELHRQFLREVRSCKYGRRDAQWALRRALNHARELVYVETPLLGPTKVTIGGPVDPTAAVDLVAELTARLGAEPRLRVVILTPRNLPFAAAYAPWSMYFHQARNQAVMTLQTAGGMVDTPSGPRPRVVVAHPMGVPGRPLVIRTTTVVVDDVWCVTGTSTFSRRGLTFDGSNDVVLADWQLDRGAGVAIRAHRKSLMAAHLGVGPTGAGGGAPVSSVGAPPADWVRLHQPVSAHAAFADVLAAGGLGKLLPLWSGPSPTAPGAVIPHPPEVADPDGRGGGTFVQTLAAAIGGSTVV